MFIDTDLNSKTHVNLREDLPDQIICFFNIVQTASHRSPNLIYELIISNISHIKRGTC